MSKVIRCYKPNGQHEDIHSTLTIDEIRMRLNGWAEVRRYGKVDLVCDEEGKMKQLPFCRRIRGEIFVGDVYVGKLTETGLQPVDTGALKWFEATWLQPL